MLVGVSIALILINMNEMNTILVIFYRQLHEGREIGDFIQKLYTICTIAGLLTFSAAIYMGLSLRFGFRLILLQYVIIYIL